MSGKDQTLMQTFKLKLALFKLGRGTESGF